MKISSPPRRSLTAHRLGIALLITLVTALAAVTGCKTRPSQPSPVLDEVANPVTPWPRPVPVRLKPDGRDDLFVMTLGEVETPLADGLFDPLEDRVTLRDGKVLEHYYKEHLDIPHYVPLDKSRFPVPPSGWCSWYYYYQEIDAKEVLANARWIAEHLKSFGARYVQIDDGWQGVGHGLGENRDWTTIDVRFRDAGMDGLAGDIRDLGLEAGLWLAPHGQSNKEVAEKSGAFIWKSDGTSASSTWEGTYLVDPSSSAGHTYLEDLFRTLRGWGYTYFKIDGQPIVLGEYRKTLKHMSGDRHEGLPAEDRAARLYRDTLSTIRKAIGPDSFLLGCWGIPLPGVGIMNGSRTGGDVVQGWHGFLAALGAVQRWNFLHNVAWYCDPDVFMVRPPLREATARAWATIQGLTGQALLTSDRLPDLPPSRVEMLKRIFPATDIRPLDLFKPDNLRKTIWDLKVNHLGRRYDVVGLFNYDTQKPRTVHLKWQTLGLDPERAYHVYDFWGRAYLGAWEQGVFLDVPPADVRVMTLVPMEDHPVLVSTSRHMTQGWIDLVSVDRNGPAKLSGRSRLVAGDAYTLTVGLARARPTLRLKEARATGTQGPVRVDHLTHQGYATVTLRSDVSQCVDWTLRFEPAKTYVFPVKAPGSLHVEAVGWTGTKVSWRPPYFSTGGYEVILDGKSLGVSFTTRATLKNLTPGTEHTLQIRSVWYDGTPSKDAAEKKFTLTTPSVLHLSDLEPETARQDWGSLGRDRTCTGKPLTVAGKHYEKGLGTHAASVLTYRIFGTFSRFIARAGLDDSGKAPRPMEVVFEVWGNGKRLWKSDAIQSGSPAVPVDVDIKGVQVLELRVLPGSDGIDYDHADWLEARVE